MLRSLISDHLFYQIFISLVFNVANGFYQLLKSQINLFSTEIVYKFCFKKSLKTLKLTFLKTHIFVYYRRDKGFLHQFLCVGRFNSKVLPDECAPPF